MNKVALAALLWAGCSEYDLTGDDKGDPPPVTSTSTPTTSTTTPPLCPLEAPDPYATSTGPECRADPTVGTFTPVTEWAWTDNPIHPGYQQVMSTPMVAELTDDDGDGDIDADDVPDVVFTAFSGSAYGSAGALVVLSGTDGATELSLIDANGYQPYGAGGVAVGDLDADGVPEILVSAVGGLLAVHADGAFVWFAPVHTTAYAMASIADLDGDGLSEVVFGATVLEHDGTTRWVGTGGTGGAHLGSFAADLDGDGPMEIVAGNTVYEVDGAIRWSDGGTDGYPAIADFDADGSPEIVRVYASTVHVTDAAGALRWTFALTDGGGGPPTVADFDGDGLPEVGVASREYYRVIDTDGTELWANVVQDFSSSVTGSSVFDFEGDGAAEVVYADEQTLWVYDGATGAVELEWLTHSSGTLYEYPVIVDVDGDGVAEIVAGSNDYAFAGSRGITVIGDAASSWAAARPVWNQHAYHITNIDDDGGVPAAAATSWTSWNSFRAGNSETALGLGLPDLTPGATEACLVECYADLAVLWFAIENIGASATPPTTAVVTALDFGLELQFPVSALQSGETAWVGPAWMDRATMGPSGWALTVNEDADPVECDHTNNELVITAFPCP